MNRLLCFILGLVLTLSLNAQIMSLSDSEEMSLEIPQVTEGKPEAGKRVKVITKEYEGTNVYHTVYLPQNWKKGSSYPIIFEYTGNFYPPTGSSGELKDANLGYGLSGGQFIVVGLPYIADNGRENQLKWWGDVEATVAYAKKYVPEIMDEFGGGTGAAFLCGFSRGAIAVNFLGLYDDEIADLWSGFITHDHFDGVQQWGKTDWGSPLEKYREEAARRLKRVNGRPYLVIQNGEEYGTKAWVESVLNYTANFTYLNINTESIFESFPNEHAKHPHTDNWCVLPSKYRNQAWKWIDSCMNLSVVESLFDCYSKQDWQEVFFDSCTGDWKNNWVLDGKKASITHSESGMDFAAGPTRKEDASHAVLWTSKSFEGDIRIDYEYTKTDEVIEAVNILYIQATGSGANGFEPDIMQWADKREIPAMRMYFNHMNTYHISYAAFDVGNTTAGKDYIRARRYMPNQEGLRNTDLDPDYFQTGLFEKGVPHDITIIKKADHLFMYIRNKEKSYLCHWPTQKALPIAEGRVGLRHMWTRSARYKNFKVSVLN